MLILFCPLPLRSNERATNHHQMSKIVVCDRWGRKDALSLPSALSSSFPWLLQCFGWEDRQATGVITITNLFWSFCAGGETGDVALHMLHLVDCDKGSVASFMIFSAFWPFNSILCSHKFMKKLLDVCFYVQEASRIFCLDYGRRYEWASLTWILLSMKPMNLQLSRN